MIDCKNNEDKIISYLENDLSIEDKLKFEEELNLDSSLRAECNEMKQMLKSLDTLPKIKAKDNFIVSLNEKIDCYEEKSNQNWFSFIVNFFDSKNILENRKLSFIAVSAICILSTTFYLGLNNQNQVISLSKSTTSGIDIDNQVANADSLDSIDR